MACGAACSLVRSAAALPSSPSGNIFPVRDLVGPAGEQRGLVGLVRGRWWPVQLRMDSMSWQCFQKGRGFCRIVSHARRRPEAEEPPDLNDLWALFGLSATADRAEVRKRYREIVATEHPDKRPDDPQAQQKFRRITLAYEELVKAVERGDRPMQTGSKSRSQKIDQYFQDWELELVQAARESAFEEAAPMSEAEVLRATAAGQEADGFELFAERERNWRPKSTGKKKGKAAASRSFMTNSRSWSEEEDNFQAEKGVELLRRSLLVSIAAVAASFLTAAFLSIPRP